LEHPAKLEITGETVWATLNGSPLWSFPRGSLILIGEYTTNEGPYVDDYFVEFVTIENGKATLSKISFYAEGMDEAFSVLQKALGQPLLLELYASTDWNSRVVWPPGLADRPFLRSLKPTSTLSALMQRLKLRGPEQAVSDEVKVYIAEQVANRQNIRRQE
jgi:hypothetical protein